MSPRTKDERGSSMVEAAIGGLLVFSLILGVFQAALFARAHLVSKDGVTAGAQAGSVAATDDLADYRILQAIARSSTAVSPTSITSIIVYKASSSAGEVPASCFGGPQSGLCNVYSGSDLLRDARSFTEGSFSKDDYWAPVTRKTSRSSGSDYLGVYIKVKCSCAGTYAFGGLLDDTAVVRLQATVP